ncbi:hypothetical protein WDU94_013499 [Cyamophila willieti]
MVSLPFVGVFLETALPIEPNELEIRRTVYRTAHPERKLPYNLQIPWIDESESLWYEIIYILDTFCIVYVVKMLNPMVLTFCCFNNILISLCVYQLMFSPPDLSPSRYFKFVGQLIALLVEYFYICNCSEWVDDCYGLIRTSLAESSWYACSNRTKRDLCMLWRKVQKMNHLRFYDGALIMNRVLFVKVIKVAYTFLNFMKLKNIHH